MRLNAVGPGDNPNVHKTWTVTVKRYQYNIRSTQDRYDLHQLLECQVVVMTDVWWYII
jgi:hypothetical protein